jgi:ribosomal protein S18 acetylase RimI-like enzyme
MIVKMEERHLWDVVRLHHENLDKGFLSKLGPRFLTNLYRAMLPSKKSFSFVYEKDSEVIGFYTACENTDAFFREQLLGRGYRFILPVFIELVKKPSLLVKIYEAIRYPSLFSEKFEKAELLSLAVMKGHRGKGIGSEMLRHLAEEFRRRSVQGFKTGVRPAMKANEFYRKQGFVLIEVKKLYGEDFNFYNFYIR